MICSRRTDTRSQTLTGTVRSASHLGGALHPIPIHRRFTPTGSCKSDARIRSNDAGSGEGSGGPEVDGWQTREPIHDEVGCLSGSVAAREIAAEGKGREMKRSRASPGSRLRRDVLGGLSSNWCAVRLMRQARACERAGKVGGAHAQRLACVWVTSRWSEGWSPTLRTESVLRSKFLRGGRSGGFLRATVKNRRERGQWIPCGLLAG